MKLLRLLCLSFLAVCAGAGLAQSEDPQATEARVLAPVESDPAVLEAKERLGLNPLVYIPVQPAHSGWYYDPLVPMQGTAVQVRDTGEFSRSLDMLWFVGDTDGSGSGDWYYVSVQPVRFHLDYPVFKVSGSAFPAGSEAPSLVQAGTLKLNSLDCDHMLARMQIGESTQTYSLKTLAKFGDAECYECPAVDFSPLPFQCST